MKWYQRTSERAAIGSRVQIATLPQVCIAGHFYAYGMPICCVFFVRSAGMVIVAGCQPSRELRGTVGRGSPRRGVTLREKCMNP